MGKIRVLGGVLKWNLTRFKEWVERSSSKALCLEVPLIGGVWDGGMVVVSVGPSLDLPRHMSLGGCLYHLDEETLVYIECGELVGVQ